MLEFVEQLCTVISTNTPPPTAYGAVGAFWSVPVPGAKPFVEALFRYAQAGGMQYTLAGGLVTGTAFLAGQPIAGPDALRVPVQIRDDRTGDTYPKTVEPAYPSAAVRALCLGQPARFGRLLVTAPTDCLLPELHLQSTEITLRWRRPLTAELAPSGIFSKLLRRVSHFEILGLHLTHSEGTLLVNGRKNLLLPSLIWQ